MTHTRRSKPTPVGEAVAAYLRSAGLADRVGQAAVVDAWPELVGERIARAAHPESVAADGTLFVRVKSSAWRQELSLMTPEVLALLNGGRAAGRIKRIRWLVGSEAAELAPRFRTRRRPEPEGGAR
jgi:predicted nucleic acid-binding Zn ribbon protein